MNDVGEQAEQTEQLANTMLQQVYALLARHNIIPNAYRSRCSPPTFARWRTGP
jgi:hypothetical protein